jgi:hypothetical protein
MSETKVYLKTLSLVKVAGKMAEIDMTYGSSAPI